MMDLIMLAVLAICFISTGLLVYWCHKQVESQE